MSETKEYQSLINQNTFLSWDMWQRVDLDLFRKSLPELKFSESTSILAIAKGAPTEVITEHMKNTDFVARMGEYVPKLLAQISPPKNTLYTPTQTSKNKR